MGTSCQSALDVWDVCSLEIGLCFRSRKLYLNCYRHPAFPNKHSSTIPLIELVEDMVDGLHLANHHIVRSDVGSCSQKKPVRKSIF